MNQMKGIIQQIEEQPISRHENFTFQDLENFLDKIVKSRVEYNKEVDERVKSNRNHLLKRSKELGKEIPNVLLVVMCSRTICYVDTEFLEKYKEWL